MRTKLVMLSLAALFAVACEDARNGPASTQCRAKVNAARSNVTDATVTCRACCLENGAARGLMRTATECDCVGRAANSGLDREQQ